MKTRSATENGGAGVWEGDVSSSMRVMAQIVAVFLLLVVSVPLYAQSSRRADQTANRRERDRDEELDAKRRIEDDLRQAQFSSNRFYLISRFELGDIGIGIGAEDLYLPSDEAIDGLAIGVRAPQRLYYIANRRTLFSIDAEPGYIFYLDSDRENRLSWLLRGDVHLLFPYFYVNGFATISDELVRETTELDRLTPRDTTQWGINTEIKPSSRTSMELSFVESDIDYDSSDSLFYDPRLNLLERTSTQYKAEGRHHTFPITRTLVGASRTDYDFPLAGERDSTETFVYVGADRDFSTHHFVARIGRGELDYKDSDGQDFSGILGDARFDLVIDSRHSMMVAFQRELEFSMAQNNRHYRGGQTVVPRSA